MENIGVSACVPLVVIFTALALVFHIGKGKTACIMAGFNTLPKEERATYDTDRMMRDARNDLLVWAVVMVIGALACAFICRWIFIIAYIVWAILFLKGFHLNPRKAFARYKK